jgi:hypothetical protein
MPRIRLTVPRAFAGSPVPDDERGQPDEVGAVQPEHLTEVLRGMQRGFIHTTQTVPRLGCPLMENYAVMVQPWTTYWRVYSSDTLPNTQAFAGKRDCGA